MYYQGASDKLIFIFLFSGCNSLSFTFLHIAYVHLFNLPSKFHQTAINSFVAEVPITLETSTLVYKPNMDFHHERVQLDPYSL